MTQVSPLEQVKDQVVKEVSIFMQGVWSFIAFHICHYRDDLDELSAGQSPATTSNLTKLPEWKRWELGAILAHLTDWRRPKYTNLPDRAEMRAQNPGGG